jgi:aminocarboxymuconate-semialdehyde decarboxylase
MGAIDVHTHLLPPDWPDLAARYGGTRWPRLVRDAAGGCALYLGGTFNRALTPSALDAAARLPDLERLGVERQVLSPPPPLFCYWAEGPAAAEFCRIQNDHIAAAVAAHPDRFLGAATLPLQAPDLAVRELERVVSALGFRCIEVGTSVDGRDLDDPSLAPVWEAAAALDVAVFVHPAMPVVGAERLRRPNLSLIAGNPLETALAMSRLVYGGVVERWPALRWCFAHGGGAFALILGRLDHGWQVVPEARSAIPRPPQEYARTFWVDSLTHSPAALRFAVDTFGAGRVVLGSDYPFRMGTAAPVAALDSAGLTPEVRAAVLEHNARKFLGLGAPRSPLSDRSHR